MKIKKKIYIYIYIQFLKRKKMAQVKPGKPVKPATRFMRIGLPP
jgi:hypothetical protein